jgi:hypothetical protein
MVFSLRLSVSAGDKYFRKGSRAGTQGADARSVFAPVVLRFKKDWQGVKEGTE